MDSNAVRAGGAYVEAYAKNNMGPGLAAASKDIQQFSASAQVGLNKTGQQFIMAESSVKKFNNELSLKGAKHFAKEFKEPLEVVTKVAAAVFASAEAFKSALAPALEEMRIKTKKLGEEMEYRLERVNKQRQISIGFASLGSPEEQRNAHEQLMNEEQARMTAAKSAMDAAEATFNAMRKSAEFEIGGQEFSMRGVPIFGEVAEARITDAETKLEHAKTVFKDSRKAVDDLGDRINELTAGKSVALAKMVDDVAKSWQANASAVGMSAEALAVLKLRQAGVNDELIKSTNLLDKMHAAEQRRVTGSVQQAYLDFRKQAGEVGLSPEAARLKDLREQLSQAGLSPDTAASATAAAVALAQKQFQQKISEAQERAMFDIQGGTKGGFGTTLGPGTFEFGGGGQWQSSVLGTLKDLLQATRDVDKNIANIKGDYFN